MMLDICKILHSTISTPYTVLLLVVLNTQYDFQFLESHISPSGRL